ncbi:TlpA disulfide reductase family protein [Colwellia sp. UCD-KL20]|uniref:TlpA family protein disulfide reductase n=1 Tax=Colwellia sp. UCD-KL20 TaxID=1917165 RepID=UPI000970E50C|nr:TlpA disulfide reductase family protein [Colwellia sp. UCD-KL20]
MFRRVIFSCFILISLTSNSFAQTPPEELQQLLQQHKGSVIYVDFWASWCGPCRKSFPWMNEIQQKHENLKIISVNVDNERALAAEFLDKVSANFPIIYDPKGKIAKKYKLKGMPSSYIYNKAGLLVSSHVGFTESKQKKYEEELQYLLAK